MFARTSRLTLRPGWPEDAPALLAAIAHERVARMTGRVPWPYALVDAEAHLARPADPRFPISLVFERRGAEPPRLVGSVGLSDADGEAELGYWLTPDVWGRGYATEAAAAMLGHARALGRTRVQAGHFTDNPASGKVLVKLGFQRTGERLFPSLARGGEAPALRYALAL
jgi:RimJ/RimL family protein N-acetyltransferase